MAKRNENNMCQRPKRAFIISTKDITIDILKHMVCQRPKRAFIISTALLLPLILAIPTVCQRPKRAFIISTAY